MTKNRNYIINKILTSLLLAVKDNALISKLNNPEFINSYLIRRLQRSGAKLGKNIFIGQDVYFEMENIRLLIVEDDVVISSNCKFIFHDSSLTNTVGYDIKYGQIILRRNCYIGSDTLFLPGSEVGQNTVVGAGSLVTGILKPNSVYLGRPARLYCSLEELRDSWQTNRDSSLRKMQFFVPAKKWYSLSQLDIEQLCHTKNDLIDRLGSS